jgi:hypothetical protein
MEIIHDPNLSPCQSQKNHKKKGGRYWWIAPPPLAINFGTDWWIFMKCCRQVMPLKVTSAPFFDPIPSTIPVWQMFKPLK